MIKISTIHENHAQNCEIEIFSKYLDRALISRNFSFQRCIICLCYFNCSQMNRDREVGRGGMGSPSPPRSGSHSVKCVFVSLYSIAISLIDLELANMPSIKLKETSCG